MRKVVREYLDKQPEFGDKIEIVNPSGNLPVGAELIIVDVESSSGNLVWTIGKRFRHRKIVHDNEYVIYEDVVYEKVGEERITKTFLGIPVGTRIEEKWEVVDGDS